jgi:hypothetical protein
MARCDSVQWRDVNAEFKEIRSLFPVTGSEDGRTEIRNFPIHPWKEIRPFGALEETISFELFSMSV